MMKMNENAKEAPVRNRNEVVTDKEIEELWAEFADIPMDPVTECIEEDFMHFKAGTYREDIWHWFDERHSKGVAHLLYGDGVDRTEDLAKLQYRSLLCDECCSETCIFNPEGICRFPLVCGRKPNISEDGCADWVYKEQSKLL